MSCIVFLESYQNLNYIICTDLEDIAGIVCVEIFCIGK